MSIHAICGQDHPPGTRCPRIELNDKGDVIFLARAPGQVADNSQGSGASVNRGARSGNPNFDPKTGRFGSGNAPKPINPASAGPQNPVAVNRSGIPQGVDVATWERRLDTVRLAARQFAALDANAAQGFLKGKVKDLSQVNVDQFVMDVRAQQLDDLVDLYDANMRSSSIGQYRTRRNVRLAAPKSWVNAVTSSLVDSEMQSVVQRLLARGWSAKALKKNVISKVKDADRRKSLEQAIG